MAEAAQDNRISVRVNGESRAVAFGSTIAEMLAEIGINPLKVAVERNLEIVPRSTFGEVRVHDGDSFEVVHFVGGG
jgi:thiazole synthase